jgi:2',3'-cyclic-nucleotide 2'-phosphodiesterase (5'-nucleotidase family)
MVFEKTGDVYITKAHANARSAYIVNLAIDKNKKKVRTEAKIRYLNESVAFDSTTNIVVQKWKKIAEQNFADLGFDPNKVVIATGEPLEGRETETRSSSTNLTRLVTDAMLFTAPQAEVVIFNSGSIRVDDILTPPVTQYDIIRTLPFGGGIREVDMKGSMLIKILETGMTNKNSGGFLQFYMMPAKRHLTIKTSH